MPLEDDDGPLDEGTPAVADAKKAPPAAAKEKEKPASRFHPRFLKEAERFGISQEDIEACSSNSELRELIELERASVAEERSRQTGRGGDRTQTREEPKSPPPPPPEPDWDFEENFDHVDPAIAKELKRLGKSLLKATKNGDKDRFEELKEEIAAVKAENASLRAKDNPIVKRADAVIAKYPNLFGTQEERDEDELGEFAVNMKRLERLLFGDHAGSFKSQGKLTGQPEKDIPAAIARLFPGVKPGGKEAAPASQRPRTREELWNDAGTPPASHRNSADQTGKPGGKRAAAAKIREKLREEGYDVADDTGDDDDDEI